MIRKVLKKAKSFLTSKKAVKKPPVKKVVKAKPRPKPMAKPKPKATKPIPPPPPPKPTPKPIPKLPNTKILTAEGWKRLMMKKGSF